eukprot:scaffold125123_cov69-Phaeocystis_antarctica.AAC.2
MQHRLRVDDRRGGAAHVATQRLPARPVDAARVAQLRVVHESLARRAAEELHRALGRQDRRWHALHARRVGDLQPRRPACAAIGSELVLVVNGRVLRVGEDLEPAVRCAHQHRPGAEGDALLVRRVQRRPRLPPFDRALEGVHDLARGRERKRLKRAGEGVVSAARPGREGHLDATGVRAGHARGANRSCAAACVGSARVRGCQNRIWPAAREAGDGVRDVRLARALDQRVRPLRPSWQRGPHQRGEH